MRIRDLTHDDLRRPGVYRIKNLRNGKTYIGQGQDILHRYKHHCWALKAGRHDNAHLSRSWHKHGEGAFEFSVVVFCRATLLTKNEQAALDGIASPLRYNQIGPVDSPCSGRKFSAGHRRGIGQGISKPVFVTYPDGNTKRFPSQTLAAEALGCVVSYVSSAIKTGHPVRGALVTRDKKKGAP